MDQRVNASKSDGGGVAFFARMVKGKKVRMVGNVRIKERRNCLLTEWSFNLFTRYPKTKPMKTAMIRCNRNSVSSEKF